MAGDFATAVRPLLEAQLEQGETLRGVVAATHQKTFSGSLYGVGVTERRLLLQPLDRKLQPKGDAVAVNREAAADAELDGAGGGWWTAPSSVLDATALTLKVTAGDERLKLMMMRGGSSLFGGERQADGVVALAEWLAASRPSS